MADEPVPTPRQEGAAAGGEFRTGLSADQRLVLDSARINDLLNSEAGDVAKALLKIGLRVEREAKQLCPVDTGRLRASIASRVEKSPILGALSAVIGTNVEYAPYVELGTVHMAAQPFLVPAVMTITGQNVTAIATGDAS